MYTNKMHDEIIHITQCISRGTWVTGFNERSDGGVSVLVTN